MDYFQLNSFANLEFEGPSNCKDFIIKGGNLRFVIVQSKMEQATLPNMDHFSYKDGQNVYEPAEDTYLLCDGILNDKEFLFELNPEIIVEVGSGSGCVIVFTTMLMNSLMKDGCIHKSFALDINPKALEMTQQTAAANNVISINNRNETIDI